MTAIEIPPGAHMPVMAPGVWLAAADRAGWQCECTTPATGVLAAALGPEAAHRIGITTTT